MNGNFLCSFFCRNFAQQFEYFTELIQKRIHIDAIPSTNTYARELIDAGETLPEMTLITTDDQSRGRGQKGNSWESEAGKSLTFSIVCHPDFVAPSRQFILSQAIALAVCSVDEHLRVKWPNDIYFEDRKISGTLIECDLQGKHIGNCIIGTGLNVNQTLFRSDAPNPVSLKQIYGKDFNREEILQKITDGFDLFYEMIRNGRQDELRRLYLSKLYRREGWHEYEDVDGRFKAEFVDIEPTGHLLLRKESGLVKRYEFKEVRFCIG